MKNTIIKTALFCFIGLLISACNGFFEKDNTPEPTPLVKFTPETQFHNAWYRSANFGVGSGTDYLRLIPAVDSDVIITASKGGVVTATNKFNGSNIWHVKTCTWLTAGPTVNAGYVFVGTRDGRIIALREADGKKLWATQLASEVLAPPAAGHGYVIAKTMNGQLSALSETDGHIVWQYLQVEPDLILRGGSTPQINGNNVVVGFANGNLSKLGLRNGDVRWQQRIAIPEGSFAIQRMVDIDSNPQIYGNRVYVATYQGKISALDLATGRQIWSHDISSYQGLTVGSSRLYVSDARGNLWAFDRETGRVDWKQTSLRNRDITGPTTLGNAVIVADQLGYLHALNKSDGRFIARTRIGGFGVLAAPITDGNRIYVLTKDGHLAEYTLG